LQLRHAFDVLNCVRVELKTDARNERSRRAMEAIPAHFEGIHRRHRIERYGRRDTAWYSVIADEWPEVRANLERRLSRHLNR
jgi:RimJ/RimL family protein N-acetyltransferase